MTQIPAIPNVSPNGGTNQKIDNALGGLNMDDFLKLLIAELQNQDPLDPMKNSEMMAQISQIREIGATDRLTDTLDSVLLGQNVSNATNLIGKQIEGLDDTGNRVSGVVDRVTILDNTPTLHVNGQQVSLTNVSEIIGATTP